MYLDIKEVLQKKISNFNSSNNEGINLNILIFIFF